MGRKFQPGVDKIKEEWVKERVKEILNAYPKLKLDMPPAAMYGNAGRHDFIVCQRGLFWTIETKAGTKEPTPLQVCYAEDIRAADGMSLCVNECNYTNVAKVAAFIEEHGSLPYSLATDFLNYKPARTPC